MSRVEVVMADDEVHGSCLPGQEDGSLAGGVASADDRDGVVAAESRLVLGRGVIDSGIFEFAEAVEGEASVRRWLAPRRRVGRRP